MYRNKKKSKNYNEHKNMVSYLKRQKNGKGRENSYWRMKRSPEERHIQTQENYTLTLKSN